MQVKLNDKNERGGRIWQILEWPKDLKIATSI